MDLSIIQKSSARNEPKFDISEPDEAAHDDRPVAGALDLEVVQGERDVSGHADNRGLERVWSEPEVCYPAKGPSSWGISGPCGP